MAVTSRDVAKLAGVSQPTVSRALRGDSKVSDRTRQAVLDAAEALGYVPSEAGRSLVTRQSRRIGVVVSDLTNPFYPYLIAPLHDELESRGYRMMVFTERSDQRMAASQLLTGSIDGAVLLTTVIGSPLPAELRRRGLPFVFLNREAGDGSGDAAVVDNVAGGRMAAHRLTQLGHRRIAGIFGPDQTSTGRERKLGFIMGLADAGVGLAEENTLEGPFESETGERGLRQLVDRPSDQWPTAVFCGNDVIAMGVINAAMTAGIQVPSDLSVLGFDDIPLASWEAFQLSTIGHDLDAMAASAARLLVQRLSPEGREKPAQRVVLRPELIERGTLRDLRTE
ncbi:LacI family DNA-binding transcriptional regulator [Nesterenkonia xinjiangensis]|uniref:LacI family transcriptional regulator n=1 Tax=Nesterenkonia xinjiangensis TaxID=225327 RepID=A0A7Z0GKT2_9MICC|nr:LacI family DNA-binding transcriptional regulator [Nesterenkonia xinjiangensis]NYJ77259.1 LacI family transcriptional regulator [Nesterenkonia xinjiangensis]